MYDVNFVFSLVSFVLLLIVSLPDEVRHKFALEHYTILANKQVFILYLYWFSDGRMVLNEQMVLTQVIKSLLTGILKNPVLACASKPVV